MKLGSGIICARLKALREAAGHTQEELATIAGLSVHVEYALGNVDAARDRFMHGLREFGRSRFRGGRDYR